MERLWGSYWVLCFRVCNIDLNKSLSNWVKYCLNPALLCSNKLDLFTPSPFPRSSPFVLTKMCRGGEQLPVPVMWRARKKFHRRSVTLQNPAGPSCALHQFDEEVLNDLFERESLERLNQPLTAERENLSANWNSLVFCPGYKVRNTHAETVETAWHHRLKRRPTRNQRRNARVA